MGTLLRGDALYSLSAESRLALVDYGVRTVIDLRRVEELHMAPNDFAESHEVRHIHVDLVGDAAVAGKVDYSPSADGRKKVVANRTDIDRRSYVDILEMRKSQVAQTLLTLAAPETLPALFHCGIGKDRTGVVAALVLALAGVPAATIAEDYALSSRYLIGPYLSEQASQEQVSAGYDWRDFMQDYCSPDAILHALDHLRRRYGGVESYALSVGLKAAHVSSLREAIVE